MEKAYAKALQSLAGKPGADEGKIMSQLMEHLRAVGRTKLLPGILAELRVLAIHADATDAVHVEVADEKDSAYALLEAINAGMQAETVSVNPSLISGWRARKGAVLKDHSGKRALIDMYRSVTNY